MKRSEEKRRERKRRILVVIDNLEDPQLSVMSDSALMVYGKADASGIQGIRALSARLP